MDEPSGFRVPQPPALVRGRRRDESPVRAEFGGVDLSVVRQGVHQRAGAAVPNARGTVLGCGDHPPPVAAEPGGHHVVVMALEAVQELARLHVPKVSHVVGGCGQGPTPVGAEHRRHQRTLAGKRLQQRAVARVPQPGSAVERTGQYLIAGRTEACGGDVARMALEAMLQLAVRHAPEPRGAVDRRGQHRLAVGTERNGQDGVAMAFEGQNKPSGRRIP